MDSVQVLTSRTLVSEENGTSATVATSSRNIISKKDSISSSSGSSSREILGDISNIKSVRNREKSVATSQNQSVSYCTLREEQEEKTTRTEEEECSQTPMEDKFSFLSHHDYSPETSCEELEISMIDNLHQDDNFPPRVDNIDSTLIEQNGDTFLMAPEEGVASVQNTSIDSNTGDNSSDFISDGPSYSLNGQEPSLIIPEEPHLSEVNILTNANPQDSRPVVEFDDFIVMGSESNSSHSEEGNIVNEKSQSNPAIRLVEEMDRNDISMVSDYADDIFTYWKELEQKLKPNPDYMSFQSELQWHMRRILLDWLVQVHERFRMLQETLFLSVNYIDRFLSLKEVSIEKFQLVGTTALFIAAKYEEIAAPTINEMIYMVSGTYTCEELKNAEKFMINLLNYELGFPGPLSFLRRISKADHYDPQTRTLAKYLIEVTIMYESFIKYTPSLIAAAGYYLAMRMLGKTAWTATHQHYSGFEEAMLLPCVRELLQCLETPSEHEGIYKKYENAHYMNASQYVDRCLPTLDVNI